MENFQEEHLTSKVSRVKFWIKFPKMILKSLRSLKYETNLGKEFKQRSYKEFLYEFLEKCFNRNFVD